MPQVTEQRSDRKAHLLNARAACRRTEISESEWTGFDNATILLWRHKKYAEPRRAQQVIDHALEYLYFTRDAA